MGESRVDRQAHGHGGAGLAVERTVRRRCTSYRGGVGPAGKRVLFCNGRPMPDRGERVLAFTFCGGWREEGAGAGAAVHAGGEAGDGARVQAEYELGKKKG